MLALAHPHHGHIAFTLLCLCLCFFHCCCFCLCRLCDCFFLLFCRHIWTATKLILWMWICVFFSRDMILLEFDFFLSLSRYCYLFKSYYNRVVWKNGLFIFDYVCQFFYIFFFLAESLLPFGFILFLHPNMECVQSCRCFSLILSGFSLVLCRPK